MNGKEAFVASLIISIVVSVILSYAIAVIVIKQGPQGEQGIQGIQGIQGSQGERGLQGIPGKDGEDCNCEADISASLEFAYTDVWFGTDYHDVEGLMINFGTEIAWDVEITIQWHLNAGGYHEETHYIGTLLGHEIFDYSHRFYFEGGHDYVTWEIKWH